MNIYEDEQLERTFNELSDQLGKLVLDILLAGLKKANNESEILQEFEDARTSTTTTRPVPF